VWAWGSGHGGEDESFVISTRVLIRVEELEVEVQPPLIGGRVGGTASFDWRAGGWYSLL